MIVPDRCPDGKHPAREKYYPVIQGYGDMVSIEQQALGFRFVIPASWTYENNILQDKEEPISSPWYLFTFSMTDQNGHDAAIRVFPAFCNTQGQWTEVLTQRKLVAGTINDAGQLFMYEAAGETTFVRTVQSNGLLYEIASNSKPQTERIMSEFSVFSPAGIQK